MLLCKRNGRMHIKVYINKIHRRWKQTSVFCCVGLRIGKAWQQRLDTCYFDYQMKQVRNFEHSGGENSHTKNSCTHAHHSAFFYSLLFTPFLSHHLNWTDVQTELSNRFKLFVVFYWRSIEYLLFTKFWVCLGFWIIGKSLRSTLN